MSFTGMHKALSSTPSTTKKEKKKRMPFPPTHVFIDSFE
jgi:hypothetical protein